MKSFLLPLSVAVTMQTISPLVASEPLTLTGKAGIPVSFSALESYDPEGGRIEYLWNFGEDVENSQQNGIIVEYTYSNDGIYNVMLKVEDEEQQVTVTHIKVIIGNVTNQPPTIEPIAAIKGVLGSPVIFDAVATDSDGSIAYYLWEADDFSNVKWDTGSWNGHSFSFIWDFYRGVDEGDNGVYYDFNPYDSGGTSEPFSYKYYHPGKHTAKLTVIDNEGQASIRFIDVEIIENSYPVAKITNPD